MDKIAEIVLKSFETNRKTTEDSVQRLEQKLSGHKHGIFCFHWRNCQKIEIAIAKAKEIIEEFKEAEKGLLEDNYDKAIDLLGRISADLGLAKEAEYVIAYLVSKQACNCLTSFKASS